MSLTKTDVEKIAHLARLSLSDSDVPGYVDELSSILALVERMNSIDTEDVQPMAHPLDATQRLRPDHVTETDERDKHQCIAPMAKDGLYLVPRVIE